MQFVLLAPGPSMTAELAERVRDQQVGAINNVYELAPWATFLAANDIAWWRNNPLAKQFAGRKFSSNRVPGVETVRTHVVKSSCNSGVLALECAKRLGASRILLLGFDMHGTHYFGRYENGLTNTSSNRRKVHQMQFDAWWKGNKHIEVVNCTSGTELKCFPRMSIDDAFTDDGQPH